MTKFYAPMVIVKGGRKGRPSPGLQNFRADNGRKTVMVPGLSDLSPGERRDVIDMVNDHNGTHVTEGSVEEQTEARIKGTFGQRETFADLKAKQARGEIG